jgi:hypothetical protein
LSLVGFGRGDALADPGAPVGPLVARGNRVELIRAALTEWYVNDPDGIEQGFTIPSPPLPGRREQPVVIEMQVSGEVVAGLSPEGQEVLFRTATGRAALRYDHLAVLDAMGRRLPSKFESSGDRIRIVTDDGGAIYPIVVDPLVTDPDWSAEGNQSLSRYGLSVASAGDVNGDGFDDVIVGASLYDNFEADEGVAFLYHGSAAGPSVTPSWTVECNQAFAEFGESVASGRLRRHRDRGVRVRRRPQRARGEGRGLGVRLPRFRLRASGRAERDGGERGLDGRGQPRGGGVRPARGLGGRCQQRRLR